MTVILTSEYWKLLQTCQLNWWPWMITGIPVLCPEEPRQEESCEMVITP